MNINHLYYFVEAVKLSSINKAAKSLFITQSSLSGALTALEKELGLKLIYRTYNGISLTKEGKVVFEDAVNILKTINSWSNLSTSVISLPKTTFPVAIVPSMHNSFFNDVILELCEQNPEVTINTYLYTPK